MTAPSPRSPRLRVIGPPPGAPEAIPGAGLLAMKLFVAALGMLFVTSLIGYVAVRARAPEWPPADMPPLPDGLWFSTVVLVACSGAIHFALRSIRRDHRAAAARWLAVTFALGVVFLVSQTFGWFGLVDRAMTPKSNLYAFTFFLLTGLHAAHVLGGLIPLGIVTWRAFAQRYDSKAHGGIEYQAIYWHFLDVVWVILFVVLLIGS